MATIDLIVLGMLKNESMSAYDMQKLVEYRHISEWVKISTPSVYKKVIQLEQKGYVKSVSVKEGRMAEKAVYSLTEAGEAEFVRLMQEVSCEPVYFFLDFNAVIVNLESLPPEQQRDCLQHIENSISLLQEHLLTNISEKERTAGVSKKGLAVLRQQLTLAQAVEAWIDEVKDDHALCDERPPISY